VSSRARKRRGFQPLHPGELARLTFQGAAGEVTGSCYLLETHGARVLIDCGLIQGRRQDEARNARRFPFDPRGLDAVLLTHAHIDHSGRLPKLVKDGFRGPIHATSATCELLGILLPDSAHIQVQDARRLSRRRLREGRTAIEPLYTTEDAERALEHRAPHGFNAWIEVTPGIRARFRRAGHILGAASLEFDLEHEGTRRRLVVSGDVGREAEPLLHPPDPPQRADLLLLESTYGDRDHRSTEGSLDEFAGVLADAQKSGANVIVPVFAVGRAQEVLFQMARFEHEGRIRREPVFLDSPMAISVTELHGRHTESYGPAVTEALERGVGLAPRSLRFCRSPEESMALNERQGAVILAASGMCSAGRVVHHLKHNLWRPSSHVVIVGFQARGTVGRALVDGARKVRILGETVLVRAQIHTVGGFSAHGGQTELLRWASPMLERGTRVALVHGEPDKRSALEARLCKLTRHPVWKPDLGAVLTITKRGDPFTLEGPQQTL
jgi:metallo-beta-lactamase family protein